MITIDEDVSDSGNDEHGFEFYASVELPY